MTDNPNCKELATLPLDKMLWHLVQDHKFIEEFVGLMFLKAAKRSYQKSAKSA